MTGVSRQKQKLLTMKKLFETKTDEKHTITGNRLIEILGDYGIKAERKTIYDDIKTLCDSGMDIEITKDGHSNAYYLAQRLFQDEELYVLADAVASSRFLTQKKSKELLKKIQSLTSEHKAKDLRRMVYVSNRTKTFNEQIYYAINSIQEGIFSGLEIHFKYYEYTVENANSFAMVARCIRSHRILWFGKTTTITLCAIAKSMKRYAATELTE